MNLKVQKRIAADVFGVSTKKVKFDVNNLDKIKEAITKQDIKGLIKDKLITKIQDKGISRVRANYIRVQKIKGNRKGPGSRKGKATARFSDKDKWILKVRSLRNHLLNLKSKSKIDVKSSRLLYRKIKGGFFRNKGHLNLYISEHNLWQSKK